MKELVETINDLKRRLRILEQRAVVRGSAGIDCVQSPAGSILALNDRKIVYAMVTESEQFTDEMNQTNYRHSWQEVSTSRVDGSFRDGSSVVSGQRRGNKNLLEYNRQQIATNTVLPIRECENGTGVWYGNARSNLRYCYVYRDTNQVFLSGGGVDPSVIFRFESVDTGNFWDVTAPTFFSLTGLPATVTVQIEIETVAVDTTIALSLEGIGNNYRVYETFRTTDGRRTLAISQVVTGPGGGAFWVAVSPTAGTVTTSRCAIQIASP